MQHNPVGGFLSAARKQAMTDRQTSALFKKWGNKKQKQKIIQPPPLKSPVNECVSPSQQIGNGSDMLMVSEDAEGAT